MKTLILAAAALILLGACSRPTPSSARAEGKAPRPGPVNPPRRSAPAEPPPLLTEPAVRQAELPVIEASFKEVNRLGYPVVVVRNISDRDIDDIRGSFRLVDDGGSLLHTADFTDSTPGVAFLAAGAERDMRPDGLNRKADLMKRLRNEPEKLTFSFQTLSVTFMDR